MVSSTVGLQKIGELYNPTKIAGEFGKALSLSGSTLFVGDSTCDHFDLVTGQKFTKAGAVYVHDIELGTTSVLLSPQPRDNGIFGARIAANSLYLCVNEKTLDTNDQDGGVVHIFDHATLTYLATIEQPLLPRPQEGSFSTTEDTLFYCFGGYKDGLDKNVFPRGKILVVSLNPLSPTLGSVIKVIEAPKDKQGGLTILWCHAKGDVLLVGFVRYADPNGSGTQLSEEGFLLYDLRYLHLPEVPYAYVSQAMGESVLEEASHDYCKIHDSFISVKKTVDKNLPSDKYRELVGFYEFSDLDSFDTKTKPTYIPSPVEQVSGFGQFVNELDDHVLVSTPWAYTLSDGTKYYGDIYAIEKASIGSTPVFKSILKGDPSRPRVGEFAATSEYLAVALPSGKYGGAVEIYSLSMSREASTPLNRPAISPTGSPEPIRAPFDLWDADTTSVPSNPNRTDLDASTVAMLEVADTDGALPPSLTPIELVDGKRTAFVQALLAARYVKHTEFGGPKFERAAPPGQSYHEYGLAIDIRKSDAAKLKLALEAAGFKQLDDEAHHFTASASSQIPKANQRRKELKPSSDQFESLLRTSFSAKKKLVTIEETIEVEELNAKVAESQIAELGKEIKEINKEVAKLEKTASSWKDDMDTAKIALHSAKQFLNNFKYNKCPNGNDFDSCTDQAHEYLKKEYLEEKKVIEKKVKVLEADYVTKAAKYEVTKDKLSNKKSELVELVGKKKTKAIMLAQFKQKLSKLKANAASIKDKRFKTNAEIVTLLSDIDSKLAL